MSRNPCYLSSLAMSTPAIWCRVVMSVMSVLAISVAPTTSFESNARLSAHGLHLGCVIFHPFAEKPPVDGFVRNLAGSFVSWT